MLLQGNEGNDEDEDYVQEAQRNARSRILNKQNEEEFVNRRNILRDANYPKSKKVPSNVNLDEMDIDEPEGLENVPRSNYRRPLNSNNISKDNGRSVMSPEVQLMETPKRKKKRSIPQVIKLKYRTKTKNIKLDTEGKRHEIINGKVSSLFIT